MQTIFNIIIALFGLTRAAYNRVDLDPARGLHARYVGRTICLLALLIATMVALNYFEYKGVNLAIALVLALTTLIIATRPEPLLAAAIAGIVAGTSGYTTVAMKLFLKRYFLAVGDIIFWVSIFGLFLGTVSCRNNLGGVLSVAIALIVIGYGSYRWNMGPTVYKWIIYNYAILTLVISILSFVSADTWIHWTGHDLGAFFHSSKMEEKLAEAEQKECDLEEATNTAILQGIMNKLDAKKPLSESDKKFMETMKEKRDKNSLPGLFSEKLSGIDWSFGKKAEVANVIPMPAPTPVAPPALQSTPVAVNPPAPAPVAYENVTGNWNLCWNNVSFGFYISDNGDLIKASGSLPDGGKLIIEATKTQIGSYRGTWNEKGIRGNAIEITFAGNAATGKITGTAGEINNLTGKKI